MPTFPSTDWFESVRCVANADAAFRSAGTSETTVGVKIGARVFILSFVAFECAAVSEAEERDLLDVDFYLDMSPDDWRAMLSNIAANDGADSEHTLNTLDVERGIVAAATPYGKNNFARYHLTVQRFFDVSAQVQTAFG